MVVLAGGLRRISLKRKREKGAGQPRLLPSGKPAKKGKESSGKRKRGRSGGEISFWTKESRGAKRRDLKDSTCGEEEGRCSFRVVKQREGAEGKKSPSSDLSAASTSYVPEEEGSAEKSRKKKTA